MNFALFAASASNTATNDNSGTISLIVMVVVMGLAVYFLMIRPQKKKEKKATELRNSIDVGDEVTTIGGIVGRVVSIKEDTFIIETAGERSRMRFKRWAIQEVGKLGMETASEPEPAEKAIAGKAKKEKTKEE
ncbi:MAG: preprotein translocase subunit YajC [Ruminococcaceae bacterium]|nr:preprotein translocase subunit YajC [Oscillospiraceae bacterium]